MLLGPPVTGSQLDSQMDENPYSPLLVRQFCETTVSVPRPTPAPHRLSLMVLYLMIQPGAPSWFTTIWPSCEEKSWMVRYSMVTLGAELVNAEAFCPWPEMMAPGAPMYTFPSPGMICANSPAPSV